MSLTVTNPSYDRVYTMYAWRDNNNRLVLTQGEGATTLDGTVTRIKAPRFQLRDDQGVMNLSGSPVISLALTRPDKSEDLLACTIIDAANGIVSCPITASATAIAGQAVGEIWVSSTNGTIKFYGVHALIHKGVSDDAAAQSSQFSALIEALQQVGLVISGGSEGTVALDTVIQHNGTKPVASGVLYDYLQGNYRQISFAHENNESSYDDGGVYIDDATDIKKMYYVKNSNGARVGILFCVRTPGYNYGTQVKIDAYGNITTRVKTQESGETDYTWKSWTPAGTTRNIQDGAVTADKLGASAVTTGKINDGAVTNEKLADGAVKSSNIENSAITLEKIGTGVIDNTLSAQGAAAEAKATGAEINDLKTALTDGYVESSNLFNPNTVTIDKRIASDGSLYDQSGDYLSDYIPVSEGQILCFCKKWGANVIRAAARSVCAFNSSKTAIPSSASMSTSYSYTVPSGVSFVRIGIISGTNESITVTPTDVMIFLSDTDSPSSYTFEGWFAPGLKPKASLADNANGGVDVSLFGSEKTLAKQSDMAAVKTSISAAQKVSVVRYSRSDNLYYCYETYENSGSIYMAFLGAGGLQSENPFLSISFSTLKTALPSYVDTSPDGIECIRLDHRYALIYDYENKTFSVTDVRGRTGGSKLIIAQCANGMITDGIMHNIIVKEKVDRNTKSLAYRSRSDQDVYGFTKRVQQDQTDKTLTILFITDTHLDSSSHPYWDNYIDFVEKFGSVPQHCGVGLAIHGGDILTTGYTNKTVPLETLNRFCAAMRSNTGNAPMFILKGNHDDNSYGQKVGGVQQFNYAKTALIDPEQCGVCMFSAAHNDKSLVFDAENPNGGYCYYDDEISKIRVIMLNTNDNPGTMTGDNYNWNSTRAGFQERQLEWLSDVLKFEDRQDAAEWAVYIVSHIPIEISHNRDSDSHGTWFGMGGTLTNGNIFFDILHAFENGTSGTSSSVSGTSEDWSAEVSYSFSRQGNFIGFLCGHMHADNTSNAVGGTTGTEYGYRYIGITAGFTFAAVTINRENNSISVRKYGGYNHITENDNTFDSIIGLTDEDVNEYGDFTVEY